MSHRRIAGCANKPASLSAIPNVPYIERTIQDSTKQFLVAVLPNICFGIRNLPIAAICFQIIFLSERALRLRAEVLDGIATFRR